MKASFQKAQDFFQQHHGLLRTSQARRLGISGTTISQMTAAGLLVKESRGVYRLASAPELAHSDLVTVALRIPYAVICLISALDFYDLTTQIPHPVNNALPKDQTKAPRID
jgi:predicted transcriptional regulator of viral defense system